MDRLEISPESSLIFCTHYTLWRYLRPAWQWGRSRKPICLQAELCTLFDWEAPEQRKEESHTGDSEDALVPWNGTWWPGQNLSALSYLKKKKMRMIIQIKANQDKLIKLIKHYLPLSSNKMFSGFISLWVIPTLCRYSCQSATGNLGTAETHSGCQINYRVLFLLTTADISCWKNLWASFSGIPTSGSLGREGQHLIITIQTHDNMLKKCLAT